MYGGLIRRIISNVPPISTLKRQRDALHAERRDVYATLVKKMMEEAKENLLAAGDHFLSPPDFEEYEVERIHEIRQLTAAVQGWVSDESGLLLYFLVRERVPIPTVVELGSWKGRSTIWLASALRDRGEGKVFAVDTWRGTQNEWEHRQLLGGYAEHQLFEEFAQSLRRAGLEQWVEPIQSTSADATRSWPPDRRIGLLFVDADHGYEAVSEDFRCWSPFVVCGGYIVLDDVPGWPGPTRLALELPRTFRLVGASSNQIILRKSFTTPSAQRVSL
jgi:predicted O-methyltransferase YrrM